MPNGKDRLSFDEARREIENASPYEYRIHIRETNEVRNVQCAGGESLCLIQTNAKALSLLDEDESQMWRIHKKRVAIERIYKSFPPELRYPHEHPVHASWKKIQPEYDQNSLPLETECLRAGVHQLLNHGLKRERTFELLARILPRNAPRYFKNTGDLKADTERLRLLYEESEVLRDRLPQSTPKRLEDALKQIEKLEKELQKAQNLCARLMATKGPPAKLEKETTGPPKGGADIASTDLNFEEIEAWSAKKAAPLHEGVKIVACVTK